MYPSNVDRWGRFSCRRLRPPRRPAHTKRGSELAVTYQNRGSSSQILLHTFSRQQAPQPSACAGGARKRSPRDHGQQRAQRRRGGGLWGRAAVAGGPHRGAGGPAEERRGVPAAREVLLAARGAAELSLREESEPVARREEAARLPDVVSRPAPCPPPGVCGPQAELLPQGGRAAAFPGSSHEADWLRSSLLALMQLRKSLDRSVLDCFSGGLVCLCAA